MTVSDGATVNFPPENQPEFVVEPGSSVLRKVSSSVFVGFATGTTYISAVFQTLSRNTPVTVLTESVFVRSLAITPLPGNTFMDTPGSRATLSIEMLLSDGSRVADAVSAFTGFSPAEVFDTTDQTNRLLLLQSSHPTSIDVREDGTIQLLGSHGSLVQISVVRSQVGVPKCSCCVRAAEMGVHGGGVVGGV